MIHKNGATGYKILKNYPDINLGGCRISKTDYPVTPYFYHGSGVVIGRYKTYKEALAQFNEDNDPTNFGKFCNDLNGI